MISIFYEIDIFIWNLKIFSCKLSVYKPKYCSTHFLILDQLFYWSSTFQFLTGVFFFPLPLPIHVSPK